MAAEVSHHAGARAEGRARKRGWRGAVKAGGGYRRGNGRC
jgi:hypothetical protein